ncbi:MAG: cyclase family protein [Ardenticatenaceae bacterium]
MELIDLSQDIFTGMPVFGDHPQVNIVPAVTHEQRAGIKNPTTVSPTVHEITLSEHSGTHVDAFNHFAREHVGKSIDTMPLSMFYTEGICLDLSHKGLRELIEVEDLKAALDKHKLTVKAGDTVLLYTNHYRRYFGTPDWINGPGISADAARWFGEQKVSAFGVEMRSPGVRRISNKQVHIICGQMGYTHYENLINLHLLLGKGRFRFIGLPIKIRGGTGAPVRAVAVLE